MRVRLKRLATVLGVLIVFAMPATATEVSLDHVDGLTQDNLLVVGGTVTFHLRLTNNSSTLWDIHNGFRVYSPDGASWSNFTADTLGFPAGTFSMVYVNCFSCDGWGADTVGFAGIGMSSEQGLPAGYDDVPYTISINTRFGDQGRLICLDSSWVPPGGTWKWSSLSGDVIPDWDGPHCFMVDTTVTNPAAVTLGDVDGLYNDTALAAGTRVTFYMRLTNNTDYNCFLSNGFEVYSPDGAEWSNFQADTVGFPAGTFDQVFINCFSCDGVGADTAGFSAFGLSVDRGIPPGFDANAYKISIDTRIEDNGKHICIDSAWAPPGLTWAWSTLEIGNIYPSWDGPHCFVLDQCVGTGDDSDGDGIIDNCDPCTDIDGDGFGDPGFLANICPEDNCPTVPNPDQADLDQDGLGDACDNCQDVPNPDQNDVDDDSVGDACDNCPDVPNPTQIDTDADSVGNDCDNCPDVPNIDQADPDGDNVGSACDNCPDFNNSLQIDTDNDNVGDSCDNCPDVINTNQLDTDNDGIGDECDTCTDTDRDGYGNPGFPANTCPEDNCPSVYNAGQEDYDGDGIGDLCDTCTDADGDGFGDPGFWRNQCQFDNCPEDPNVDQSDLDGDGIGDACDPGQVMFTADRRCGSLPLLVTFSDTSVATTTITDWFWDFGDGSTSYEQNPQHEYTSQGAYDVMLMISNGHNVDSLIKTDYIVIQDSVSADFVGSPTSGPTGTAVMFEPILTGAATGYFWDFGDGTTSTERNPIHIYNTQGFFDVMLRVDLDLDECIQVDTVIKQGFVKINDLDAAFSGTPRHGTPGLTVQFTDLSPGLPTSWLWDFGDGATSTAQNPEHTYSWEGVYDVKLVVDNGPFSDSTLKLGYIHVDTAFADLYGEIFWTGTRPGFEFAYYNVWTNIGTYPAENCTLKVLLPPEMEYYHIYYTIDSHNGGTGTYTTSFFSGDTLVIPLGTIEPSSWYGGYVTPYGRCPEWIPIGDSLTCESWLTTTTAESDYDNNDVFFRDEIVGSIDPNDKSATPAGEGPSYRIADDQRINYLIQFENKPEATAEAIYVRVVDTLDPNLDWGTLVMGDMSHPEPCSWDFDPYTGVITWFCDSIMLPPNHNPPEGEGFFRYSISPKPDLPNGTEIRNEAFIRFDYNAWLHAPEAEDAVVRTIYSGCCVDVTGNVDCDGNNEIDISDVTVLIKYLFLSGEELCCPAEANVNGDMAGEIDIGDLTSLIIYMFIPPNTPPADCP